MGAGDNLMALGEARKIHKRTGQKVMIVGRDGRPVKSELFVGVPYLVSRPVAANGPYQRHLNCGGHRPYIVSKTPMKWTWRPYRPIPAEIFFTPAELAFAEPYRGLVMLEPSVKNIGHKNKDWGPINWQQLDSALFLGGTGTVQCGPEGTRWLLHTQRAVTATFRLACAVLSVCRAYVGPEGGLHHAAAAVGTPAVVIWSEFISPEITGYAHHRNLRHAGKPCGSRVDCEGCRRSLLAITPSEVLSNLKEILNG